MEFLFNKVAGRTPPAAASESLLSSEPQQHWQQYCCTLLLATTLLIHYLSISGRFDGKKIKNMSFMEGAMKESTMSLLWGSQRISHGKGSTMCKYQSLSKINIRDVFVQNNIYEPTVTVKNHDYRALHSFKARILSFIWSYKPLTFSKICS